MRFLVTGATGFVGGALARRLLDDGEEVSVLVRDAAAAETLAERGAAVHAGTVADPNEVREAARDCEVVFHCAAESSHRAAPRALAWVNVAGTENVLNAARVAGVKRLVYISCADVTIVDDERVNWNEDRYLTRMPLDEHARTKQLAEELVLAEAGGGITTTALRPATLWGPGDTTTLPGLCREGLRGGVRLVGHGKNLVAATYIDHLVDAALTAAEVVEAEGNAYYVADGEFLEARELYGGLCEAAGLPPPRPGPSYRVAYIMAWLRERAGRDGPWRTDVVRRGRGAFFDCSHARKDLQWEPTVTLKDGLAALAAWVKDQGGPQAVARMGRPPATAESVDAQVASAGGD